MSIGIDDKRWTKKDNVYTMMVARDFDIMYDLKSHPDTDLYFIAGKQVADVPVGYENAFPLVACKFHAIEIQVYVCACAYVTS